MNYLFSLALKNIKRHPVQSLLTILGIALSVAIILAVFMANGTMKKSLQTTMEKLGTGKTDIWIQELTEEMSTIGSKQEGFEDSLFDTLLNNKNILSVHPSVKTYTTTSYAETETFFYLYGVQFANDQTVRNHVLSKGHYPDNDEQILIGENLAKILNLKVGSEFSIPTPKGRASFIVSGLLSSTDGAGTLNNNAVVFADLYKVQASFGYENKVTSIDIVLNPDVESTDVIHQIEPLLPINANAYTNPVMDASSNSSDKLMMMAFVFAFISIFIAIFVIYNTLSSSVEQSRKELGLLRLLGMTNKQVKNYFFIQSLIYSVIGSIVGTLLGIILGTVLLYMVNIIYKFQTFFIEMPSVTSILISAGVGIITTVIVGLFPAIKASKTSPMSVFRNYETEVTNKKLSRTKNIVAIALIIVGIYISYFPATTKLFVYLRFAGPALMFVGICNLLDFILPPILNGFTKIFSFFFGLPGLLAIQSLQLRLKRTVITIGSITVAVSIFIGLFGSFNSMKHTISDWYDQTKWADIIMFSVSGAEIDESILSKIDSYSFIEKTNPLRYYFVPYAHENLSDNGFIFQGIEPEKFKNFTDLQIKEGNVSDVIKQLENEPSILVNENILKPLKLKVGDTIKLNTINNGSVDFKIVGSIADYSDFIHRLGKVVYGSYGNLSTLWNTKGYTVIQIKLSNGSSRLAAKEQLMNDLSGKYNIKVITHDEEKKEVSASADQIFSIIYALNIIIFIIVFMGIFNTILINVLFQIREFAVLRTLGFFSSQVRKLVIYQALALGIIGSVFATLVGLWLSKQMTLGEEGIMGAIITHYMPLSASLIMCVVTIGIALLATIYPQKIATGISISKVMQSVNEI